MHIKLISYLYRSGIPHVQIAIPYSDLVGNSEIYNNENYRKQNQRAVDVFFYYFLSLTDIV